MRTRNAAPCGHASAASRRWQAAAAATASVARTNTENVESPSPFAFSSQPPWLATQSAISSSWRVKARSIAAAERSHSAVEPTTSLSRNVTTPDGGGALPGAPALTAAPCSRLSMLRNEGRRDATQDRGVRARLAEIEAHLPLR